MFQAALVTENIPFRCTFIIRSQSYSVIFQKETSLKIPALFIIMSTFPKVSTAVFTILSPNSTESKLAIAYPPFFLISSTTTQAAALLEPCPLKDPPKSLTTTLAPLEAKNKAYYFPNPPPAPVTITTLLSNLTYPDIFF